MSDSEDESPDKQLKIVVMGDGASGKVSGVVVRVTDVTQSGESLVRSATTNQSKHCHAL